MEFANPYIERGGELGRNRLSRIWVQVCLAECFCLFRIGRYGTTVSASMSYPDDLIF